MTFKELAKKVAKKEKGKQEISIAQISEILKVISIESANNVEVIELLIRNGRRHTDGK